ncbi:MULTISPECIES: YkvA family protein [unclassified Prochlorococcus]|uniref:YkvA family protein n=1 Tax=unclassified Prochlorococcus TaxID=2627481 RepID=UPI00053382D9|nr:MULTISPECIES: DUF1232 domain-containing protein [unclassified Prochlorococcus]KGG15016.1 hypothetical protein EV06_1531 [Prochlorococcus sp. MIT 0602]KGG17146.1 hypothetical protein EV07_0579 [Prochlorococcus sp. MIT 0603]
MTNNNTEEQKVYDTEVIDSSVIDEGIFKKVLLRAGRTLAKPALEAFEMLLDTSTPPQARVSLIAALTYLIMPIDLMPDFIPVAGFSDDLVAITAVISLWSQHMTPEIRNRARRKLDTWFPL